MIPPRKIWVNVYNPVKPESWDIHSTENNAVANSIGAPTHCYYHESEVSALRERVKKAEQLVNDLAAWSTKYPRSTVYPMSKTDMDDELIELENRTKEIAEALTK